MNNNNKQKSASANKVAAFFKKNGYFVLMIACIIAIGAMITIAAVVNANKDGSTSIDKPVTPPDDGVVDEKPDDNKPIITEKEFILTYPLTEYVIGLKFSNTELVYLPTNGHWATHEAVDFMASEGSNVKCVFDGTIKSITTDQMYATTVVIEHQNGYESTYKLLENVTLKVGETVKQGDVIGQVSVAGAYECASGAHVHYELRQAGVLIDPFDFLPEGNK